MLHFKIKKNFTLKKVIFSSLFIIATHFQSLDNIETRKMLKLFILLACFYLLRGFSASSQTDNYLVLNEGNFKSVTEKGNLIVLFLKERR